jgi:hypothetical protein
VNLCSLIAYVEQNGDKLTKGKKDFLTGSADRQELTEDSKEHICKKKIFMLKDISSLTRRGFRVNPISILRNDFSLFILRI